MRALACVALWLCATPLQAHIVYGGKTLREQVAESDLVVRAHVVASGERVGLSNEGGSASRPVVQVRVLEVLKGDFAGAQLHFAQHGHGVATFAPGQEALVFLVDIARTRELHALGHAGVVQWVSLQEHDEGHPLLPHTREALLAAVRSYAAAGSAAPGAREALLRRATVGLIASRDADLAASALRDLVTAPEGALVGAEDLPVLEPLLDDAAVSMGVRVALLTELSRRGLVESDAVWLRWLSDPMPPRDRLTAIRAAGASGRAVVGERLVALLGDGDAEVVAAAVGALGRARRPDAVAPLAQALAHGSPKVRHAAVRALGRIATPEALDALREAAASHAEHAVRRRARAELDANASGVAR